MFEERPLPPEHLGRFVLRGPLGRGGMGTVLEAYDATLERTVALKVLHPTLAEPQARRLVREARALAKLSHPNVVQVYEVGEVEDVPSSRWSWCATRRCESGRDDDRGRAGGPACGRTCRRGRGMAWFPVAAIRGRALLDGTSLLSLYSAFVISCRR